MLHSKYLPFPIQICKEIVAKVRAAVVEPQLLVNGFDLLHVFRTESEIPLQVASDPRWRLGLAKHRVALGYPPRWNKRHRKPVIDLPRQGTTYQERLVRHSSRTSCRFRSVQDHQ